MTLRRVGAVGVGGRGLPHPGRRACRLGPARACSAASSRSRRTAGCTRRWSSRSWPRAHRAGADNAHDPGLFFASASCRRRSQLDAVRDALVNDARIPRRDAVHRRRGGQGEGPQQAERGDCCSRTAQAMAQALSSASSLGDWRLLFIQRDRIAAVTAADVNRVAKTYFQQPNRTVGVYIPAGNRRGSRCRRPRRWTSIVKDYKGGTVGGGGRGVRPVARQPGRPRQGRRRRRPEGRPAAEEEPRRDGVAGADAALRQRGVAEGPDDRGRHAAGPDDGRHEEARPAGATRGAGRAGRPHHAGRRRSAAAVVAAVAAAVAAGAAGQLTFSVEAKRDTLAEGARAARRNPPRAGVPGGRVRDDETPHGLDAGLAAGPSRRCSPATGSAARCRRIPRTTCATCRRSDEIDRARSRTSRWTRSRRSTRRRSAAATRELGRRRRLRPGRRRSHSVKEMLAGWESKVPVRADRPQGRRRIKGGIERDILTPDKANAEYLAGLSFPLSDDDPDYAALRLGNFIFGGEHAVLAAGRPHPPEGGAVLRRDSSLTASPRDPVGSFTVTAITNPANIDKVDDGGERGADRVPDRRPDRQGTGGRQAGVPGVAEGGPHRGRGDRRADRLEPEYRPHVRLPGRPGKGDHRADALSGGGRIPQATSIRPGWWSSARAISSGGAGQTCPYRTPSGRSSKGSEAVAPTSARGVMQYSENPMARPGRATLSVCDAPCSRNPLRASVRRCFGR